MSMPGEHYHCSCIVLKPESKSRELEDSSWIPSNIDDLIAQVAMSALAIPMKEGLAIDHHGYHIESKRPRLNPLGDVLNGGELLQACSCDCVLLRVGQSQGYG